MMMMMRIVCVLFFISLGLPDRVEGQTCQSVPAYARCSLNTLCGCLPLSTNIDLSICSFLQVTCSSLVACANNNRTCYQPDHVCVQHDKCQKTPLCYPLKMASQVICPPMPPTTTSWLPLIPDDGICGSATWTHNGVTVIGGNDFGSALNQLDHPLGFFVDDDAAVYVADSSNNRVVKWVPGASNGQLVAGGSQAGNSDDLLDRPTSVVVDKNGNMFICDRNNKRVQQWLKNENQGQPFISNISCWGVTIDNDGFLYVVSDDDNHVTKWYDGEIVAGGQGAGDALNQLSEPHCLFVDRNQSIFVADSGNHRIVKWVVGAQEGIIVAGGNGIGNNTNQLNRPVSVTVDRMGTMYIVDYENNRVLRWFRDAQSGTVVIGESDQGDGISQLNEPADVALDRDGNLYVVDHFNSRIQKYTIDKSSCTS